MNDTILQLEQTFNGFQVPKGPEYNHGFLEIIGKETHENTWSKLYAHFLEDLLHNDEYPFLEALYKLVEQRKGGSCFRFNEHVAKTEVATKKGRIDLVIEDKELQKYIIVENKVYHYLNNDLLDYWNHFKVPDENKVGVLLTLSDTQIPRDVEDKFICITHSDWVSEVEKKYTVNGPFSKQDVYLKDFIKTVKQVTNNRVMNEQSAFFFRHASEVNAAIETKRAAEQYIQSQYPIIADKLGLQLFGNDLTYRNYWDESNHHDIYFTLNLDGLFEGKKEIEIIIELYRKPLEYRVELQNFIENEPQFKEMKSDRQIENDQLHFCYLTYPVTEFEISRLADFVVEKIQSDFGELFVKLIRSFPDYKNHDISSWEKRVNP